MNLEEFLALDTETLTSKVMHFCHCSSWVNAVANSLPVADIAEFEALLIEKWRQVSEEDLLEAFAAHPRIGDMQVLRDKFATQANAEQGQVKQADEATLQELMTLNDSYFEKFGFIFIICAKGKPADEMLVQLKLRLANTREVELQHAADEQQKIMLLRFHEAVQ